jgi:ubiquinone/menaquinone biosynthesis C-methylase UbiE
MKKFCCAVCVGLLWISGASASLAQEGTAVAESAVEQSVRPNINENFLDANLDVEQWLSRFEGESREVFAGRDGVVQACGIKPGASVADIGAGTGLYTMLFAKAAGPEGWVYGVDISARFLEHLNQRADNRGVKNITAVLGSQRSVNLPPDSIDLAFVCDTYHHFEYPRSMLRSLHRGLRDGGHLIIVDFERVPGESREWILNHVRAGKEDVRREVEAAGFEFVEEVEIASFQENYFLRFRKKS